MPVPPELAAEIESVYSCYAAMVRDLDPNAGLGGKLLLVGELTPETFRLVRAANIAGAGSLCATTDAGLQRRAIREGVIDFLVTSLDEALRILKNEIRRRSAVAVAVGANSAQIVAEMVERGVLPDLLPPAATQDEWPAFTIFESQGACRIDVSAAPASGPILIVADAPAGFEAHALALVPEADHAARRWLRLSPRYLGPAARRARSLPCEPAIADALTSTR